MSIFSLQNVIHNKPLHTSHQRYSRNLSHQHTSWGAGRANPGRSRSWYKGEGSGTSLLILQSLYTARRTNTLSSSSRNTVPHFCGICLFFQTIWNSFPYLCILDESVSNRYSISTLLRQQPHNFISRFVGKQHRCIKSTFQYLWSACLSIKSENLVIIITVH